jgi:two-component system sensor histidine kinase YesM
MLAIALVIGVAITLSLARRNARRTTSVMELFRKAEAGEALPDNPPLGHDEYDFMIETLIGTFLKQRYATLHLSERQARAEVLELKALRAQMNPHFLFNTLESLYWMVFGHDGKPSPAADMIKNLSMLLKYSLEESEFVSLGDEIDMAKRYLAIQLFRYKDKFEVAWEIDEGASPCQVVKFFLQPLLENAIYHGIRDKAGSGLITIRARIDARAGLLLIGIADDGAGMEGGRLEETRKLLDGQDQPSEHIGLFNTNRHIQLVFGREYGIGIRSAPGKGTLVEVRFPVSPSPPRP